jgi:HEAT repeat protein
MGHDDKESSGIISVVSRQAGTVAGTSVVIGKKIAGCSAKTATAAKDWLKQPLKTLMPARDKKSRSTSETSVLESRDEQETGRKKAAKALIAVLESDLAAAQRELKKVQNNAEKTQSKLASQLGELKAEKESLNSAQRHLEKFRKEEEGVKSQPPSDLSNVQPEEKTGLSDRAEEKIEVVLTEEKVESAMEPTVTQSVEELNVKTEEQPSQGVLEVEMPSPVAVTDEEAQAAVFPSATDKIIFMRALSDIASEDVAARADAARVMASISHELSVRVLVAQMAREPSPQARQECIKALTTLGKQEGLPAIEGALTDESASVRLAGVRGLYHVAGAESASALTRMFSDESEGVRRRAASCVGWLGQKELAVELLPLLTDSSISVRRAAAEAMGNLRSRQVVSALIERLNDPEKSVRKAVLGAIETTTGKKMKEPFPTNEKSLQRLIARWREWWKEELLGR